MALAGLWHGAACTFILWGIYHGVLLSLFHAFRKPIEEFTKAHRAVVPIRILVTFVAVLNGWIYFRAESLQEIAAIYSDMGFAFGNDTGMQLLVLSLLLLPLLFIQWRQRRTGNLIWINGLNVFGRSLAFTTLIILIALFGLHAPTEFIYFQF